MSFTDTLGIDAMNSGRGALDYFRTGIAAYKKGDTEEAVRLLRYAAAMGYMGAKWKLARMYAEGDGVPESGMEAYIFFLEIVHDGADPGSQNESYISDALVALGHYMRKGIAGTSVKSDPVRARFFYVQAASNFGNPRAQFELGRMLLLGEGGDKNLLQAARWFQLSAKKGNAAAQAMLGSMLFQAGKKIRGLAMMTVAFERAKSVDRDWIQSMWEKAFSVSAERDRRTAISLASDISF
ncbi:MAG: hypothetical protein JSC085_000597 [Candidatus Tokpelaia sp. JSC085]|nr:MAG: hypothetical protein JSC085_000597 [Candidatus Tokpelaia sp. JSC085]